MVLQFGIEEALEFVKIMFNTRIIKKIDIINLFFINL
jgi:hypothetical protein